MWWLSDQHFSTPPTIRAAIEAAGAVLRHLPPYSPDFNPIENAFAKLKALPRKAAARNIDDLWDAIRDRCLNSLPQSALTTSRLQGMNRIDRNLISMDRVSETVCTGGVAIETYVDGDGPALVILPSYGRDGGEDFDDITARAVQSGWRALRPQPRGIAGSRGPMPGVTLHDLADDVAAVIRELGGGRAVLLGHAFGHALSRMVATDHPDLVAAVILAASQASKVPPDIAKTPLIAGDLSRPEAERLDVLRRAFFAPGHNARAWLTGWYPETLRMQHEAAQAVPQSVYWACGRAPMLEVFGALGPFKPCAYWRELGEQFCERVTSVQIPDASHALFPEQPEQVAQAVMPFLARHTSPAW